MELISNELYLLWNAFYTFFIQLNYENSFIFLSELKLIPTMFLGSIVTIIFIIAPCYFVTKLIINNYKKSKLKLIIKSKKK